MQNLKYFSWSIGFTVFGLVGGYLIGGWPAAFIVAVLAVLETSLSFDNAVVNATVLRHMDEKWRQRFLLWGILIAVFGMRIVFPLVIVAVLGRLSPWEAVVMAATDPERYSQTLLAAHVTLAAFGGAFLAMVGLKHFFDHEKEVHWIHVVEAPLARLGRVEAVAIACVLVMLWTISAWLPEHEKLEFVLAGIAGVVVFIATDGLAASLDPGWKAGEQLVRSGLGAFLYLEVLDASFSFDGVIGAFALSNNLFVIAIGLGVGAMFVRSLTIMLVEKGTLSEYPYLEHGAFWAIASLGLIMFLQTILEIPEVVTGLIGAAFIGFSFHASLRHNRRQRDGERS